MRPPGASSASAAATSSVADPRLPPTWLTEGVAIDTEHLTAADLHEIGSLRDRYGVLSVYVDADPREQAAARPGWVVAVENGLREVRERAKASGDRARWRALVDRLDELEPEIAALLDARRPGRGRALFATVEGGMTRTIGVHVPLRDGVALDEIPHLTPLVAAFDRGRPVGILVVSHSDVRVLEHRLGLVDELATISLEPDTSEWREMKGPAAANPALAQHAAPQRDRFERRLDEHRLRALEDALGSLGSLASRQEWESAVVGGDRRLADRLADALENGHLAVTVVDRNLHGFAATEVADAVRPELEAARNRRESDLVSRARDAALSGNAGALGIADVLGALQEGRVGHLLLAEGREHAGVRAPDGRLLPAGVSLPGLADEALEPVDSLTAHMVERALATDAHVTVVSPPAAEQLAESDGVAALLRW